MKPEIDRRTFLKRMGQVGGLVAAGGTLESFLAACGGNVYTGSTSTPTPGVTPIGNAGLKTPGLLQWGATSQGGAPYVFPDPNNPTQLVGFEYEIGQAMARLMRVGFRGKRPRTVYSPLQRRS
jgi:polar amino acid transport system substrate-binding protein